MTQTRNQTNNQTKNPTRKSKPEEKAPKPTLLVGEAQSSESDAAIRACNDFLRMGPARTVRGLAAKYRKTSQNLAPTQSYPTLRGWAEKFGWKERARQFDHDEDEEHSAHRAVAFRHDLGLDYQRVEGLKKMARFLEDQIYEQGAPRKRKEPVNCPACDHYFRIETDEVRRPYHNVWVPDVKSVKDGEYSHQVDVERFNGAIISEYRNLLDDIAKEVGDRHKDGASQNLISRLYKRLDLARIPQEQFDKISSGANWLEVLLEPYLRDD